MTNVKEVGLQNIENEIRGLATEEGFTWERFSEIRNDPCVAEYYRLREEDKGGFSAVSFMFGLSLELRLALLVLNKERVLLRNLDSVINS